MTVIGIDPGNENSAVVLWDGRRIVNAYLCPNEEASVRLKEWRETLDFPCVIEMIGHYGTGMPAGKTIFDTCVWIGRFMESYGAHRVHTILRPTVKAHICGSARAKDGNVRQALIDRFGAPGTKSSPGVTYGISKDLWASLAVAVTWLDLHADGKVTP